MDGKREIEWVRKVPIRAFAHSRRAYERGDLRAGARAEEDHNQFHSEMKSAPLGKTSEQQAREWLRQAEAGRLTLAKIGAASQ